MRVKNWGSCCGLQSGTEMSSEDKRKTEGTEPATSASSPDATQSPKMGQCSKSQTPKLLKHPADVAGKRHG